MKTKHYLLSGLFAVTLLSGCGNDYEGADWVGAKMQINGTISNSGTRVAADGNGTDWEPGDAIGLYTSNNGIGNAVNQKFTTTSGGATASFASETSLYLLTDQEVNVTGYYPHIEDTRLSDGVYNFSIADENGTYVVNDFMFASNTVTRGDAKDTKNVDLAFNHKMNRLQLDFSTSDVEVTCDENTEISCTLNGLITDGTFNTKTGEIKANSTTGSVTVTHAGPTVYLIYPPQATKDVTLNIKIGDVYYTAKIPTLAITGPTDNATLKYNVKITGTQVMITFGGVSISGWNTPGEGGDIETSKKEHETNGTADGGSFSDGGSINVTKQ